MTDRAISLPRAAAAPAGEGLAGLTAENFYRCYHCLKCSSGCPLADRFDLMPNQVMRRLQLGDETVLQSRAIWLCASCHTCTTRCPQEIDVAGVMDDLRIAARRRGVPPAVPEIARFNTLFLRLVRIFGRVPELLLMLAYNMILGQPLRGLGMGLRMMRRGRLKLLPGFARPPAKVARLADTADKVAYFPGCAAESSAAEYDGTVRATARALDIDLVEPPGWVCCGASPAHATDPERARALPMSTMSTVEKMGLDTVTSACSNCFARLKVAETESGAGAVRVRHFLDTLIERAGPERIAARVEKPLKGLTVACYYGCLITRPSRVTGAEHPEYPMKMDYLVRALGAETVDWSRKTDCCGGALSITQTPLSLDLSRRVLEDARAGGAEAVVTMCPMCHLNLDARQHDIGLEPALPVFHATQLMTLAFGLGEPAALLGKNLVDPRPLLAARGLSG